MNKIGFILMSYMPINPILFFLTSPIHSKSLSVDCTNSGNTLYNLNQNKLVTIKPTSSSWLKHHTIPNLATRRNYSYLVPPVIWFLVGPIHLTHMHLLTRLSSLKWEPSQYGPALHLSCCQYLTQFIPCSSRMHCSFKFRTNHDQYILLRRIK